MKTRKFRLTLAALLSAASLATALPAAAGGSVSLSISPGNGDERRALAAGLVIYSLLQGGGRRAVVTQRGTGNAAALRQTGPGNIGAIHQDGSGHSGTLVQQGSGNAFGLFQFGRGASAGVVQRGRGGSGVVVQYGW